MDKERKLIFDSEGLKVFGAHLRTIRKQRKFTQKQLAFESGINFTQIIRIEKAQINPTFSTIFALSRTMDVPLKDLFDFNLPPIEKHKD